MRKPDKTQDKPKTEKPAVLETAKIEGSGNRADSCAHCAGSKFC
jgi:hypothetical protein